MADRKPVLLHFWNHEELEEIQTDAFRDLVKRADTLFLEDCSHDCDNAKLDIETEFAAYLNSGILGPILNAALSSKDLQARKMAFFMQACAGSGIKSVVMERVIAKPYDLDDKINKETIEAFFNLLDVREACRRRETYLRKDQRYQGARDRAISNQLAEADGSVVAVLGLEHTPVYDLLLKRGRGAEKRLPCRDYPEPFLVKSKLSYRRTRKIDIDLYARSCVESLLRGDIDRAYRGIWTSRERVLVATFYASIVSPAQIKNLIEYVHGAHFRDGRRDLNTYFISERLPTLEEARAHVNQGSRS